MCYDFELRYISTTKFGYADFLSRLINTANKVEEEYIIASVQLEEEMTAVLQDSADKMPITSNMIAKATQHDEMLNPNKKLAQGLA